MKLLFPEEHHFEYEKKKNYFLDFKDLWFGDSIYINYSFGYAFLLVLPVQLIAVFIYFLIGGK